MVFIMEKIITALKQQKKNPDRINVYIDDQFAFGVSRFVGAWLKEGDAIEEAKVQQLLDQDGYEQALQKALRFIAYQPRTEAEVRSKLAKLEFSEDMIDGVIKDLKDKNYINDTRFAQEWITSRAQSKPRGYKYFTYELRRKGISEGAIEQALEDAPEESDMAYRLGIKYLSRYDRLSEDEFGKKMYAVLARRVFPYEIIKNTIEKLIQKRNLERNG